MRVILVRHGETNENIQGAHPLTGIIQGRKDTQLNEKGLIQAQQTADALRDCPITHIISSPLSRARIVRHLLTDCGSHRRAPQVCDILHR